MLFKDIDINKIYRNQKVLPFPLIENNTKKGFDKLLIFVTSSRFQFNSAMMNLKSTLNKDGYKHTFTDFRYIDKINNRSIRDNVSQNPDYTYKREDDSNLDYNLNVLKPNSLATFTNKEDRRNVILDMSTWNRIYLDNAKYTESLELICKKYFEFLLSKINGYSFVKYTKFFYVPIDEFDGKIKVIDKTSIRSFTDIFIIALLKYPELFKIFNDMKIMLYKKINLTYEFVLLDLSEIEKGDVSNIKQVLQKFSEAKVEDTKEIDSKVKNEENENIETTKNEIKSVKDSKENDKLISSVSKFSDKKTTVPTDEKIDERMETEKIINTVPSLEINRSEVVNVDTLTKTAGLTIGSNSVAGSQSNNTEVYDYGTRYIDSRENILTQLSLNNATNKEIILAGSLLDLQDKILNNTDIERLKNQIIPESNIGEFFETSNPSIKKPKAKNLYKAYNEQNLEKDIDNSVAALSQAKYPLFIISKEVKDTSEVGNLKKTFTYIMKDLQNREHKIEFDMPIIIEDRYIVTNGNKYVIQNQQFLIPILKSSPSEVQIVTFYNKIFITIKGSKMDPKTTTISKFLLSTDNMEKYKVKIGNTSLKNMTNSKTGLPLDLNFLSKHITEFTINNNRFILDLEKLEKEMTKNNIKYNYKTNEMAVGMNTKTKELLKVDLTNPNATILDLILNSLSEAEMLKLRRIEGKSKSYMYASAKIYGSDIPVAYVLCLWIGMTEMFRRSNVKYQIVPVGTKYDTFKQGVVKFNDSWILWDLYPFNNSLLLNGLGVLNFENYSINDMDKNDTYIDMIYNFYKVGPKAALTLEQYRDFMIDNVSKEVLEDKNLPNNIEDLLIYACLLLNNKDEDSVIDAKNIRIRSNEIFSQFVYKEVCDSYNNYRNTIYKKSPTKVSVHRNLIGNNIHGSNKNSLPACSMIEIASSLNPILELEKVGAVSLKGPSGINKERSLTQEKRSFDKSMTGIIGISTSPDANVGVNRQLTLDPNIKSTRGYVEPANEENMEDMVSANLFTPAELLSPIGVLHDDGQRTAMAYKQSKFMVMTEGASPVLIGNKVESAIPYYLSRDFVITAKMKGKVIEENNGVYIVQYADGSKDSFTTNSQYQKNSAGGFFIESKFVTHLKVGDSFPEGEVIAYNPLTFRKNKYDRSASMNIGVLTKMAIVPNFDEYEDSAPITSKLSKELTTTVVNEVEVILRKDAIVHSMVKIGDHVDAEDALIKYDNIIDDQNIGALLDGVADLFGEEIMESALSIKKTDFDGEIVDIQIYTSSELDNLSDSLRPIVKNKWNELNKENKFLTKHKNENDPEFYKCGQLIKAEGKPIKSQYGKILGRPVEDGVLIIFKIKHKDPVKKGDKVTNYCALKGIVSNVIEEGLEPFSDNNPNEEISLIMAPGAVLNRKTPSIFLVMFGNKLLIEAKREMDKIWNE